MKIDRLLKKETKELCSFCKYHKVVLDKSGVRWQICLTCFNKEKVLPRK